MENDVEATPTTARDEKEPLETEEATAQRIRKSRADLKPIQLVRHSFPSMARLGPACRSAKGIKPPRKPLPNLTRMGTGPSPKQNSRYDLAHVCPRRSTHG
eukprot:scaffold684_cov345-Pavlova_lutheri.AAC.25